MFVSPELGAWFLNVQELVPLHVCCWTSQMMIQMTRLQVSWKCLHLKLSFVCNLVFLQVFHEYDSSSFFFQNKLSATTLPILTWRLWENLSTCVVSTNVAGHGTIYDGGVGGYIRAPSLTDTRPTALAFSCSDWGNTRRTSVTTVGIPAEIRIVHLSNTGQKSYRQSQLLQWIDYRFGLTCGGCLSFISL